MRELTDHKVNPANDALTVVVTDQPGSGGANHMYEVSGYKGKSGADSVLIEFQNGPINEVGVNGLTQEVLLAIVADRLRSFQQGPFASQEAQNWLNRRTFEHMRRGVEGTHKA